jgi:hypothetical protein
MGPRLRGDDELTLRLPVVIVREGRTTQYSETPAMIRKAAAY